MQVEGIMSTPAVTVSPSDSLREAIAAMLRHQVGSVVVAEAGVVGILTRSDVLRAAYHVDDPLGNLPVRRGMSSDVVTTTPDTSVMSALRQMEKHNIKKLPVLVDLDLVGVVTMTDIATHRPERARETRLTLDRKDDWTD